MPLDQDEVIRILRMRGADKSCARCGKRDFTVADVYSIVNLQDEVRSLQLGGPAVPAFLVVCNHCGAITQHAVGVLGLLPEQVKEKEKSDVGK